MNVGMLANPVLVRWQETALENVAELEGVSINHVIVDSSVREDTSTVRAGAEVINRGRSVSAADLRLFFDVLRDKRLKAFIYADEKLGWLLFDEGRKMEALQSRPVESVELLSEAEIRDCQPEPAGGSWNTLPADVTELLGTECDVVIRFGFGLLKGPILSAPEHGVLSTHGSDIREHRGMGPKISFVRGDDSVSVTLQQLSEEIDGGRIVEIASRNLPQHHTLDDVLGAAYDLQAEIYASGINRLRDASFSPWQPEDLGTYYSHDTQERDIGFVARLIIKNNWRRLRNRLSA